ncbi:low affinity immunoglobulin epsilon Fc receptor [Sorex fumeus]|uniref:low affinity immunoglobulin epsilon Fc receptor n=1 Tax=Sorex fumeus TaxID=62283 RepID=UPI0024AD1EA9|nr:low affinity immunoglobulin epsilon Fc receptor [Sorex fumeus]
MDDNSYSEVPVEYSRRQKSCCRRQGLKLVLLGLLMASFCAGLLTVLLLWHWDAVQSMKQLEETAARNVSQLSQVLASHKDQQMTQQSQAAQMLQNMEKIVTEQKTLKHQEFQFSRNLDGVQEDLVNLKSAALNEMYSVWNRMEKLQEEVEKLWLELHLSNGSQCNTCPEDWVNFGRKCYYFGQGTPKKWLQARNACRALQGQLVSIHSQEEQDFLTQHGSKFGTWIGLRDLDLEGQFIWMDENPLNYNNWGPGEPNNQEPSEDCVVMEHSGKWNDMDCLGRLDSWVCDRLATC